MHRYKNISFLEKMSFVEIVKITNKANEEEEKEKKYQLWLVRYPNYDKNNFETFEEFYNKCKPQKIKYDNRNKEEIMKDILKRKED